MPLLLPSSLYGLARPFLFGFDPEHAHELTLDALARTQNTPLACTYAAPRVDDRKRLVEAVDERPGRFRIRRPVAPQTQVAVTDHEQGSRQGMI